MSHATREEQNLDVVRRYFDALSRGDDVAATYYAPDVVQDEFSNRFMPNGARRDLAAIRDAAERGKQTMASQTFEVLNAFASGNQVVAEARWSGTVRDDVGPLKAGTVMRARFAIFFELRDGLIVAQRNYDCFDPW
jgi:ketosteroid isomerase-like protein